MFIKLLKNSLVVFMCSMGAAFAGELENLKKSCDKGNAGDCVKLGLRYSNGDGVPQDKPKAMKLYTKACEIGYPDGCAKLGTMYRDGDGVQQDKSKAEEMYATSMFLLMSRMCRDNPSLNCK